MSAAIEKAIQDLQNAIKAQGRGAMTSCVLAGVAWELPLVAVPAMAICGWLLADVVKSAVALGTTCVLSHSGGLQVENVGAGGAFDSACAQCRAMCAVGPLDQKCDLGNNEIVCIAPVDDCNNACAATGTSTLAGADLASDGRLYCPTASNASCGENWNACCASQQTFCDTTPAAFKKGACWPTNTDCATVTTCSLEPEGVFSCVKGETAHCGAKRFGCCQSADLFCDSSPSTAAACAPQINGGPADCNTITQCPLQAAPQNAVSYYAEQLATDVFICKAGATPHCGQTAAACCPSGTMFCDHPTSCWGLGTDCSTIYQCADQTWHACGPGGVGDPATCTCH